MSRYRLLPTPSQQQAMVVHCDHARFVWNLAVEQHRHWRPGRAPAPGFAAQARQLTAARAEFAWLAAGSVTVQQQALRDFHQAVKQFMAGTHGRATWRKAGRRTGFRQVAVAPEHIVRLSHRIGSVWVPKVGTVRFVWSRAVPDGVKSYRVTVDRAGRWHVAFAVPPEPIPAPGNGQVVGIDRGIAVTAALSTGEMLRMAGLTPNERRRLRLLRRRMSRGRRGSCRRERNRIRIARLLARETNRRHDWVEKTTTELARRFDRIRVENLAVGAMTRSARGTRAEPGRHVRAKAAINGSILAAGWGALVTRLQDKAVGRVDKVASAYTSQICNACGHRARESRKNQADFHCVTCGHRANADVNAARNIAAGRAVTARGGDGVARPANREPQRVSPAVSAVETSVEIPNQLVREDVKR